MAERESKYADKLRELGFRKTGENDLSRLLTTFSTHLNRPLTRNERRRIQKEASKPSFTREPDIEPPITQVTDEFGDVWVADGHIDLTPLGFIDGVAWLKKTFGIDIGKPKKYH